MDQEFESELVAKNGKGCPNEDIVEAKGKRKRTQIGDANSSDNEMNVTVKRKLEKGKKKSPKKKRKKIEVLEDDNGDDEEKWDVEENVDQKDEMLAGVADALAAKIEENAKISNLTTANVKSILHHLLTDKLLVEFAQRVALDATENDIEGASDLGPETRLTRSKWKKNKKSEDCEQPKFFEAELEEDSEEDEEYDPENESLVLPSDDDSVPTPCSTLKSPSLPQTPESFVSQLKEPALHDDSEHDIHCEGAGIFKFPGEPLSTSKRQAITESNDELIAYRTRSKISMKDLSLETLTASLDPPDYDPALYDFNQNEECDPDDIEWKNWLNGLFTQDEVDESVEENDEDFNFMAFEEEVDQEEFRTDKGVKVTQKELQDLLDGILDDFADNIKDQSTILKYVIPKFSISDSQRLRISAQLQQHTQLLTQVYMLSYNDPSLERESSSTKLLLRELASFRMAVDNDEQLKNRSAYYFAGLEDAARITDTLDATFELEQKLLDKNAMPVLRDVQWERRMNRDMLVDIQPRMALRIISEPFFAAYPELLPEQGSTAAKKLQELSKEKKRMKFFRSEDNLLALGIDQFGKNFDLISKHLLPVATPLQLKTRAKNLCSKRESQDNPVRFLKSKKQLPTLISTVCINHPREKSSKNMKDRYKELSKQIRLPLWIDKFHELLNRLEWSNRVPSGEDASSQVHYGKIYRPICPNGPLPVSTAENSKLERRVKPKKPTKIIVNAKGPCVVEFTLPKQETQPVNHRRKSKPRKICKVARSVQTDDADDKSLSPISPEQTEVATPLSTLQDWGSPGSSQMGTSPTYPPMSPMAQERHSIDTGSQSSSDSLAFKCKETATSPISRAPRSEGTISPCGQSVSTSTSPFVANVPEGHGCVLSQHRAHPDLSEVSQRSALTPSDVATENASNSTPSRPPSREGKQEAEGSITKRNKNDYICTITARRSQTQGASVDQISTEVSPEHKATDTSSPLISEAVDGKISARSDNTSVEDAIVSKESINEEVINDGVKCDDDVDSDEIVGGERPVLQDGRNEHVADSVREPSGSNEADNNSLEGNVESGNWSFDDDGEEARDCSYIEDVCTDRHDDGETVPESSLSDGIRQCVGVDDGSNSVDNLKENEIDAGNQEKTGEIRDSPKEKNSFRSSVNNRRKKNKNARFNWQEKLQEKASKFADLYFEKVKETLSDKPDLYCDFLHLIDEAGRAGMTRIQVYQKLKELLADYPNLIEMFVGFLEPSQAKEVGQFDTWLEFDKARTFLLSCESFYVKTKYYHELLKKKIHLHETENDSRKIIQSIKTLFRGNDELASKMSSLFPDLSPPRSCSEDFEIIQFYPDEKDFDLVDEFEDVQLRPCDYFDAEEPQQKRRTILDDFATWLQTPVTSATEIRNEVKKTESPSSTKSSNPVMMQSLESPTEGNTVMDEKSEAMSNRVFNTNPVTAPDFSAALSGNTLQRSWSSNDLFGFNTAQNTRETSAGLMNTIKDQPTNVLPDAVSVKKSSNPNDATEISPIGQIGSDHCVRSIKDPVSDQSFVFSDSCSLSDFRRPSSIEASHALTFGEHLTGITEPHMSKKGLQAKSDSVSDRKTFQSEFSLPDGNLTEVQTSGVLPMFGTGNTVGSGLRTPVSAKHEAQSIVQSESPLGTKLTKFRINSKSSAMASGFQRIEPTSSASRNQLPISTGPEQQVPCGRANNDDVNEDMSDGMVLNSSNNESNCQGCPEDCEGAAVPAGDVLYDEKGRIVYKWNRDDDRIILISCQKEGASPATFERIAQQLKGRTKTEVQERFLTLMELLSMSGTT